MILFKTGAEFSAVIHLLFSQNIGDIIKVNGEVNWSIFSKGCFRFFPPLVRGSESNLSDPDISFSVPLSLH